jgi:hypothetical protein
MTCAAAAGKLISRARIYSGCLVLLAAVPLELRAAGNSPQITVHAQTVAEAATFGRSSTVVRGTQRAEAESPSGLEAVSGNCKDGVSNSKAGAVSVVEKLATEKGKASASLKASISAAGGRESVCVGYLFFSASSSRETSAAASSRATALIEITLDGPLASAARVYDLEMTSSEFSAGRLQFSITDSQNNQVAQWQVSSAPALL